MRVINVHAVAASSVEVSEVVELESVGDAGVDVGEYAAGVEGTGLWVDVVFVAVMR